MTSRAQNKGWQQGAYNLEVTEIQNCRIICINGIMALILLVTSTVIGLITYSSLSQ